MFLVKQIKTELRLLATKNKIRDTSLFLHRFLILLSYRRGTKACVCVCMCVCVCVWERERERTSGRPRRGAFPPDFKAGSFFVVSNTNTNALLFSHHCSLSLSLSLSVALSLSHTHAQCSASIFAAQKRNQNFLKVLSFLPRQNGHTLSHTHSHAHTQSHALDNTYVVVAAAAWAHPVSRKQILQIDCFVSVKKSLFSDHREMHFFEIPKRALLLTTYHSPFTIHHLPLSTRCVKNVKFCSCVWQKLCSIWPLWRFLALRSLR